MKKKIYEYMKKINEDIEINRQINDKRRNR